MDAQFEAILIECLDALAQGESLDSILARYPQEAAQLRPLLKTAADLPTLRMEPSEAAKMSSRQKFLAQADQLRRTTARRSVGFLPRFALGFVAAALVVAVLSTGAVAASASALPGDPLYGLKRTVENVQLQSASSPTQRTALQSEFGQRRVNEANLLLAAGRTGEVEFTGKIEVIQPRAWIVSGLVVQLDANTRVSGIPQIDRVAEVRGMTGSNGLWATVISIESPDEPKVTPAPTPTPKATATPPATVAPESTRTGTPLPTVTPTATPSATPRPRVTAQPTATAEPTSTPEPVELEYVGTVNAQDAAAWIIDGITITVNSATEIQGTIRPGQRVKVKALRFADGSLVATQIDLADDGGSRGGSGDNRNDNQNSNDNHNGNHPNDNGNSNENENDNENHNNDNGNGNIDNHNSNNSNGNDH